MQAKVQLFGANLRITSHPAVKKMSDNRSRRRKNPVRKSAIYCVKVDNTHDSEPLPIEEKKSLVRKVQNIEHLSYIQ